MNRVTTSLLVLTALGTAGMGISLVVHFTTREHFAAYEELMTAIGVIIIGVAVFVGFGARSLWHDRRRGWVIAAIGGAALVWLAYLNLAASGAPQWPDALSVGMVVDGCALLALTAARVVGRPVA